LYATPAAAQSNGDTRWQAWLGCWQPTIAAPQDPVQTMYGDPAANVAQEPVLSVDTKAPHICVLPAQGNSAVDVITVADDSIVSRHHVDASGAHAVVHDQGCDGWESAQWSIDNRRVYLHSELKCSGGVTRKSDGLLAMTSGGDWLDIQSVNTGYGTAVKVMRYRDVGLSAPYPAELASGLKQFQAERMAVGTARGMVGASVAPTDVVDASRIVSPQVVQAWLAARHQPFTMDASTLESLAKQGVPGSTTDVMVALSYPRQFALGSGGQPMQGRYESTYMNRADSARIAAAYIGQRGVPGGAYDPFGWGYDGAYGAYGYPSYGYDPYGYYSPYPYYGAGSPYNPYGYGAGYGYGWYYNSAPVVIVRDHPQSPHGRAVNGGGYTRGDRSTSSGTAHPRNETSGASKAASGRSGANDSGSSTSKGTSTGRTAHKKPPV
jgi:hypothetical protein